MDWIHGKNLEFFALSRVTNGQFPLVSSFKQKKITQKFIHLFAKYWNMKLSDMLRYISKPNNHTYLKLIQLNQVKKARFITDEIRYTTAHMKIIVISNTIISKDDTPLSKIRNSIYNRLYVHSN